MEHRQQSTFLTNIRWNNKPQVLGHDKGQLSELRHNIKAITSQLPQKQILNHALNNLGLNYDIINTALHMDRKNDSGVSELKRLLNQLKNIEREYGRMKQINNQCKTNKNIEAYKSLDESIKRSNSVKMQRNMFKSKLSKPKLQNEYITLKNEVQRELLYRNFVEQLKDESYNDRKKQILANKAKKANERNKKCELVLKKVSQKQKQSQLCIFNKFKSMVPEDFSIWAKRTNRLSKTSHNDRSLEKNSNKSPYSQISQAENDPIVTDRSQKCHQLRQKKRKSSISNSKLVCDISSISNFQARQLRYRNAIQKRRLFEQQKQRSAIEKVMLKNLTIKQIHQNKLKQPQQQPSQQKSPKNNNNTELSLSRQKQRSYHSYKYDNKEDKIKNEIEQKIKKKQQLLQTRSQSIKSSLMRSRQRFLKKKEYHEKQNQDGVMEKNQNQMRLRERRKQMMVRNQVKIQDIIRKKRQAFEHRQGLSQQITNLKKISKESLQRKLKIYDQQIKRSAKLHEKAVTFF